MLDIAKAKKLVDQCWADEIVPTSVEYIKIPNKSPALGPDWAAHGYMDDAVALLERWARAKLASVPGVSSMSSGFPGAPRSSSSRSPARAWILRGGDEGLPYGVAISIVWSLPFLAWELLGLPFYGPG